MQCYHATQGMDPHVARSYVEANLLALKQQLVRSEVARSEAGLAHAHESRALGVQVQVSDGPPMIIR